LAEPPDQRATASDLNLYLVADPDHVSGDLVSVVEAAIAGGVTAVQLRCKGKTDREFLELARAVSPRTAAAAVLFLINDRVDIALACGADGVHLGVNDIPIADARRMCGPEMVIGFSPDTDEQTSAARQEGADYLGVGPVFGTATKTDAGDAIGLATIARRVKLAGIPVIGIGGITEGNAVQVIAAGAVGVAVVSAIAGTPDPRDAAARLRRAVQS
jgi:thiamine-phosphate diphosphorylase